MDIHVQINDTKLELAIAKSALAKFKQFTPEAFTNKVIGSEQAIIQYCDFVIIGNQVKKPRFQCSHCGKKVTIFTHRGSQAYKGSIKYLERWVACRKKVGMLTRNLKHLQSKVYPTQ